MAGIAYEVAELIASNSGRWSWYQLDRAMSINGLDPSRNLMPVIRTLLEEGFIVENPGVKSGQPLYSITEKGRKFVSDNC